MADYSYINNYTKNGSLAISRRVFETIAVIATNKINGAEVSKANKNSKDFNLYNPISVNIEKDGKVNIKIEVSLKKGTDVHKICMQIQERIAQHMELMCEIVPFNIITKVVSII
jgi:uncharacterized alkaline shock family protein YloU